MNTATGTRTASARGLLTDGLTTVVILYVMLYVVYSRVEAGALSASAFADLVNNSIPLAIAAAGATFVILLGGFDLSVAGVLSLVNVVLATHPMDGASGALTSAVIAIAIGAVVGLCNGFFVAYGGLQSIAVTLAMMILTKGLALVILDAPGGSVSEWISDTLTNSLWGVVPVSGLVAIAVALLWAVFRRTNTGVALYAVGKDQTAAALSGINVKRTKCIAFVMAGSLYGLAGFMLSAQTASGDPNAGSTLLLLVFASVALGGTAFTGGQGGLYGSMIGAATLMLLQKVLFSSGVQSFYIGLFQGIVMIVAVILVNVITYLARRNRQHA
ncbi:MULTISPECIES: ABC transporter permease [Paraburkholderia]|uniref:ABC transporter permease n=1 Tax=Paraburkholderia TaxID=1822464 RepID=UPI00190DBDD5|nr:MULTISPECIES: ABC transporter permease [Paraburkholderia]MBK3744884.1 ABC transporter permease [Paraburkholderia aspalathi]MBK5185856.1 ABC transporter permease [Burkholderia sp. R-69749]CAE6851770.1 Ribose import permease protein RbsC [Paraburkholderia nemoris]CAE6896334.1 Ribose import permease protein RbsC [Paraburkholderia domus]